jgi:hypothetical protein
MNYGKYGTQYFGINLNNNNGAFSGYLNAQYTHKNTYDEIKTEPHICRGFNPEAGCNNYLSR